MQQEERGYDEIHCTVPEYGFLGAIMPVVEHARRYLYGRFVNSLFSACKKIFILAFRKLGSTSAKFS